MGVKSLTKQVLIDINNKRYEKELRKRTCSYHAWITGLEADLSYTYSTDSAQDAAQGSSCLRRGTEASEGAWEDVSEEPYMLFCSPEGRLSKDAKERIRACFAAHPETLIVYGDEDVWAEGEERISPCFKPDWSPDLLDTEFYLGSLVALRTSFFECEAKDTWEYNMDLPDEQAETASYHSFVRHCVKLAGGYERGRGRETIRHIPHILFHSESREAAEKWMRYGEEEAHQIHGERAELSSHSLSVVIPSKDNPELLEKCIGGILETRGDLDCEIVVVDNGSAQENRVRIEEKLQAFRQRGAGRAARIRYCYEPAEFNFSHMCDLGAQRASGDLLLFLNDDVELVEQGTLRRMAELAARPFTGAVGLKLLYPKEKAEGRIQHVGITNLPMGPVHKLQFCREEDPGCGERSRGLHNVLAVTGACLMAERRKFEEAGGFDRDLPVAFNDVELCFALYELGYENVCVCDGFAYHDESYSRGDDESADKLERLLKEREKLYEKHPDLAGKDPYYSIHWNRTGLDTRIRPLYETQGNRVQRVDGFQSEQARNLEQYRSDACLMVRVESVLTDERSGTLLLVGWSVVLGGNNACYDKELILEDTSAVSQRYLTLPLRGQYRPDLVENVPDQKNVGLCGYLVELSAGALSAGRYRIGIAARSRVSGTKLINWSNRTLEITAACAAE